MLVLAGAFAGGLVSGLTGFGTGLVVLPIWLQVIPPLLASPLVVICSLAAQLQTLPAIWHAMDWRRLAPFVAGGALGVARTRWWALAAAWWAGVPSPKWLTGRGLRRDRGLGLRPRHQRKAVEELTALERAERTDEERSSFSIPLQ